MTQPLVSVVITNYNGEKYVAKSIQSLLDQTYPHWELVIVDDASTDRSLEVIGQFTDPRIHLLVNERNEQASYTHNRGLQACQGKYVAFLDNDDLWTPEKLEKQVAWMEANPETGACFTGISLIDEFDHPLHMPDIEAMFDVENKSREEWLHELFTTGNHLAKDSALVRRELLMTMGPNDLCLVQLHDFEFWLHVLKYQNIYLLPEKMLIYRKHTQGSSISAVNDASARRTFFEYSWLIGNCIQGMEDGLFRRVFHRELKRPDLTDARSTLCEKTLLLASDVLVCNCKSRAVELLEGFFQDPEMRDYLRTEFSFSQQDVYKITGEPVFCDEAIARETERAKQEARLEGANDRQLEVDHLHNVIDHLNYNIGELNNRVQGLTDELALTRGSISWKLTAPIRKLKAGAGRILRKIPPVHRFVGWVYGGLRRIFRREKKEDQVLRRIERIKHNQKAYLSAQIRWTLRHQGIRAAIQKCKALMNASQRWMELFRISPAEAEAQRREGEQYQTRFSILVPLYNTPSQFLAEMIQSVQYQTYGKWELCLADGSDTAHPEVGEYCRRMAKRDSRIRYRKLDENHGIVGNTNACVDMATGDYIAFFDHDDLLHPSALLEAARVIQNSGADFIYTDENSFHDTPLDAFMPNYKPDYAPDTLRSYNYICHLSVCKRTLLDSAGTYFSEAYEGSQDYDMILRVTEKAERIVHIPRVLYYWRAHANSTAESAAAKPYTMDAGKRAVADHLRRVGLMGTVEDARIPTTYRIRYEIQESPLISIIIPNKDHIEDLEKCVRSIQEKSTWQNWEIVIVENNSIGRRTFEGYQKLEAEDARIRVVNWGGAFNFSAICNYGASFARGEYILLLNNDMEIISPDWMQEMLMYAQRPDVGAVGAMLYYPDDTVQHAGVILGIGEVAGHAHKYLPRNSYGYMSRLAIAQNYSAVTAACALIPRRVWDEVQGLDEGYAVAFNDVDFCMKVRAAGYLIVWTPYAELYHYESKSRGTEDTPEKQARFKGEIDRFVERWGSAVKAGDPYYNPNLTHEREDFSPLPPAQLFGDDTGKVGN